MFKTMYAVAILLCAQAAYADLGDQLFKLLADDGALGDEFGSSVAISGAIAIVGAYRDTDNGFQSGFAYLFDTTTGRQIAKLLPDDGAVGDFFGYSVAISGATAIVGAWADDDNGSQSGSAYLFGIATGAQLAKILPDDGARGDYFGLSVAMSGARGKEVAMVGAYHHDDNGSNSGSAYLSDASSCPWDLDGSGSVGAVDLLILLVNWGRCSCPADFDGDGNVGASDLLALLVNWGPCP
ncbi:MAG: FG-GAP repeat protein [Phycisphaerales bacterium]